MGVCVEGRFDVRVTEPARYRDDIDTVIDQHCSVAVPEVVDPDVREPGELGIPFVMLFDVCIGDRLKAPTEAPAFAVLLVLSE